MGNKAPKEPGVFGQRALTIRALTAGAHAGPGVAAVAATLAHRGIMTHPRWPIDVVVIVHDVYVCHPAETDCVQGLMALGSALNSDVSGSGCALRGPMQQNWLAMKL